MRIRSIFVDFGILIVGAFLILFFSTQVRADASSPSGTQAGTEKGSEEAEKGAEDPPTGFHVYWKKGLHIDGRYEKIKFKIGGNVFVDGGNIDADNQIETAFPDLEGSDIDFRKLSVTESKLEIDFANVRDIKDIWIRFKTIPILDHIKFGHMKEPISLEEQTGIKSITFMEHALPTKALTPGRNLGIRYDNDFLEKRMTLAMGGFWSTGSFGDSGEARDRFSEKTGLNLSARITGLPWYVEAGRRLLHLGFSYGHIFRDENDKDSTIRFRTRPESRITDQRLVDTGNLITDGGDRIGVEFAMVSGPLSFQGEYLYAVADMGDNPDFWGYYLYGSYFLTGEYRRYDTSKGMFAGIKPKHAFRPLKGEWGAWELGDRATPRVDDGRANIFQTRFQISF
jgi:phosphate-selective porin OprO/OprP